MSTPTRPRTPNDGRPRVERDDVGVEHSSLYVTRRGPRLPTLPRRGRLASRLRVPATLRPSNLSPSKLPPKTRPFGVASAIAAGWAAGMGLIVVGVPVLLAWVAAAHAQGDARTASSIAADAWLAAHHVGFFVGGERFALLPLGLLVVPFLLLRLSCGWAVRVLRPATIGDAALLTGGTALIYGLVGGVVAAIAGTTDLHANPFEAWLWCTLVALVCAGWTVVRTSGLGEGVAAFVPERLRPLLAPAAAGLLALLAGAGVVTLISLLVHGGDVLAVSRALDAGLVGTLALVVLSLLYLPNLVVWAAAFCVGPGFAVGAGTSVTLAGVSSGPLPAFPLFAAIPSAGIPAAPTWLCLLVPLAAGALTAHRVQRAEPALDPESTALRAGLAGVLAGAALGVVAWLAGGPMGEGRLSVVGPSPWQVAAFAALELGLVAAVSGWLLGWRGLRRGSR